LSAAGCILNDVYREAARLGIAIDGVRVCAYGDFDQSTWESKGIEYEIEVASEASASDIESLIGLVDDVAEIPKALRAGATVVRRTSG
jgi:glutaredoxin